MHLVLDSHDKQASLGLALVMHKEESMADVEEMAQIVVEVKRDLQSRVHGMDAWVTTSEWCAQCT